MENEEIIQKCIIAIELQDCLNSLYCQDIFVCPITIRNIYKYIYRLSNETTAVEQKLVKTLPKLIAMFRVFSLYLFNERCYKSRDKQWGDSDANSPWVEMNVQSVVMMLKQILMTRD